MLALYLAGIADRYKERFQAAAPSIRFVEGKTGLDAIEEADIVVACFEIDTAYYETAFEIGMAKALGKRVILIDEMPSDARSLDMLRASCDARFDTLDKGIKMIQTLNVLAAR